MKLFFANITSADHFFGRKIVAKFILLTTTSFFLLTLFSTPSHAQGTLIDCADVTQVPVVECEALRTFFLEAWGDAWQYKTGWLVGAQPCEWYGVSCGTGEWPRNVTKIVLFDNNIGGKLTSELSLLTELRELVIENNVTAGFFNRISDFLPSSLSELEHLEVINISGHRIKGGISNGIGTLKNLRVLKLNGNEMQGSIPDELGNLTNLEEIDLASNAFEGIIPASLGNLEKLTVLDLSENNFLGTIPPELGQLNQLSRLNLSGNKLTGNIPSSFSQLADLHAIALSRNQLSSTPAPQLIKRFSEISLCSLEENQASMCIPDLPTFEWGSRTTVCNLPIQKSCSFCDSNTSAGEDCKGLESLFYQTDGLSWFEDTGWLSKEDPCEWFGVDCNENAVSGLNLPNNNLTGELPGELGLLSELTNLDLSDNKLTGQLPLSIALFETTAASCNLVNNSSDLCIPSEPAYTELGSSTICGIPIASSCQSSSTISFNTIELVQSEENPLLTWTITSSAPGIRFEVERKVGGTFQAYESVALEDASIGPQSYGITLPNLEAGIHTFRVRMLELGGEIVLSEEIDFFTKTTSGIVVEAPFPNPFRNHTTISFASLTTQRIRVVLYNPVGQEIKELYDDILTADTVETLRIQTNDLASGLYFVRIGNDQFSTTQSILLTR